MDKKPTYEELEQKIRELEGEVVGRSGVERIASEDRDITDKKIADFDLAEDHAKLQTILNTAPLGIAFTKDRLINYINQKALDFTGYRAEEIIGKSSRIFFASDENFERLANLRSSQLEKDDVSVIETRFLCRDGSSIDACFTSAHIHPGKPEKGFIVTITDISKLKESEAAKVKLQTKLMEARKAETIATLASGIAHDFNNALTVIIGNIELVKKDPTGHDIKECAQAVEKTAYRMAGLTKQLLAYARGGKYQVKEIFLKKFIKKALHEMSYSVGEKVEVVTNMRCDEDRIMADGGQLQMVFNAIIINSIEAIDEQGWIEISCSNQKLSESFVGTHPGSEDVSYVCFSVRDSGCGMDKETLNRIYEPFLSTKFAGRGLGMAAVYGIVKNHDGYVVVESEPGNGTSVQVYLPSAASKTDNEIPSTATKTTVLLIEDEKMLHNIEKRLLEGLGYHVLLASDGREALRIVKDYNDTIDMALMDVHLPDTSADILYMKLIEACPAMKVLLCSGSALEWTAQKALNAGAEGFIQKPFSLQELKEKLEKAIVGA